MLRLPQFLERIDNILDEIKYTYLLTLLEDFGSKTFQTVLFRLSEVGHFLLYVMLRGEQHRCHHSMYIINMQSSGIALTKALSMRTNTL